MNSQKAGTRDQGLGIRKTAMLNWHRWFFVGEKTDAGNQKESLAPNWIWRDVVDVAETTPAVGEGPDVAEV